MMRYALLNSRMLGQFLSKKRTFISTFKCDDKFKQTDVSRRKDAYGYRKSDR